MNEKNFSIEQSEELINNLKSGKPSEFEQLRSTLNLLAHVTELPPTALPPVLPSGIALPAPIVPIKSAKSRRTILTSIIATGMLASASLAAAAVTGFGPAPLVQAGHQTAKFMKSVVGAVSNVVTGGNPQGSPDQNQIPTPANTPQPGADPSSAPSPTSDNSDEDGKGNQNSEDNPLVIPSILNLLGPTTNPAVLPTNPAVLPTKKPDANSDNNSEENNQQIQSPKPHESNDDGEHSKSPSPHQSTDSGESSNAPSSNNDSSDNENLAPTAPGFSPSPTVEPTPSPTVEPTPKSTDQPDSDTE